MTTPPPRLRIRVAGVVQGVGFRPFVYGLAVRLGVGGFVGNDARGVFIEAEGPLAALDALVAALSAEAPPLAVIESVTTEAVAAEGTLAFTIVESRSDDRRHVLVAADSATCSDCLGEIGDPAARRYRYAFTNCTNCGPRFTIVRAVPYDRPFTTMAGFALCETCAAEYHDPADRRFHAQPVCCPACGPALRLCEPGGAPIAGDPIKSTAALLDGGAVLAIKGLGGYHLAARADRDEAVGALRARKHREEKPFAVLAADLSAAGRLGRVGPTEAELLAGPRRPIVLLDRLPDAPVAEAVAPHNRSLGVMLPYTPLHHLLAGEVAAPFVLTSGNVSDEPIAYRDEDAFDRLATIADAFLVHDREIHTRTDDSVARVFRGRPLLLRRSRGYAPEPLTLPWAWPRPVLACGAELKNTFCLAKDHHAFVSHHIGDLENYETLASFTEGIDHFRRLFDVTPAVVVHDLHPEYLSTKFALEISEGDDGFELLGVQHHHAHIASCLADNNEAGPVIGVAFDGTGFGLDGTIWGGELLLADLTEAERVGHLAPVPLPGGAAAIREPWRMAAAYLGDDVPAAVRERHGSRWRTVSQMAATGVSSPLTSSAGRLFDAVAGALGVRDTVHYEGQAAIEFEQAADPAETAAYRMCIEQGDGSPLLLHGADLVRSAVADQAAGFPLPVIAARFHNGVAQAVIDACAELRAVHSLGTVALSGGVFQNVLLLTRVVDGLEAVGFRVLTHSRVPPNDGGISLGQAAVAGARDRGGNKLV